MALRDPLSLTYHKNILGKNIFILEGFHENFLSSKKECKNKKSINLPIFFDKLFKNTKKPIDFFMESALKNELKKYYKISDDLKICFGDDNMDCKKIYSNINLYEKNITNDIDINTGNLLYNLYNKLFVDIKFNDENIKEYDKKFILSVDDEFIGKILRNYYKTENFLKLFDGMDIDYNNYKWYISSAEILHTEYLKRIKVNINNSIVKKELMKFYNDNINILIKIYKNGIENIKNNKINEGMIILKTVLTDIIILNEDIKIISILFNKTKKTKEVWLYYCKKHSENYRNFITKYLKKPKYLSTDNITQRCLKIDKFKDIIHI